MTKSWKPQQRKRYERAGSIVLNQVRLGQAPISLRRSHWLHVGLWIGAAVAVAAGVLVAWLAWDSRFYVYDAEVVGTRQLSRGDLFEASGLEGLHILWARPGAIESRLLEAFPSLESVSVRCSLPSKCTIVAAERQPRVLWKDEGEMWWIDEEGAVFSAQGGGGGSEAANELASGWRVTGPLPWEDDGSLDEGVRVALAELWASGKDVPTEFEYEPGRGLSFVHRHGWRVIVGRGSGIDERLRALGRVTAHLESRRVTPVYVDVRFPKAPYYRGTQ